MTRIVQQQRGTIDKYIGDAIMAFWNAPVDLSDHASRAVQSALDMQAALPQLNREFAARNWPEVKIGVGVNTGRMSVGNMGSEFRQSYTVMGDAVNLGSRLEGITKQYGVGILVTQATVEADPVHAFMKVDVVRVKGKALPVAIFEPFGAKIGFDRIADGTRPPHSRPRSPAIRRRTGRPPKWPCVVSMRVRRARSTTSTSNASRIFASRRRPPTGTACLSTRPNKARNAMKLTILGCSGGIGSGRHTTCFLVDDDILIDAGTGITTLSFEQLLAIDHVFITHSHLDHVLGLPLLLDAVGEQRSTPVVVHALPEVLDILATDLFNWRLWPDFREIPSVAAPWVRFEPMTMGATCTLGQRSFIPLPVQHVVPACGIQIRTPAGSLVFSGDTTRSDAFVAALNAIPDLRHLIVETSFENALAGHCAGFAASLAGFAGS